NLVTVLAQPPNGRTSRAGHATETDQHHLGIVGQELMEEVRRRIPFAEDCVELDVPFCDHAAGTTGRLPVLTAQLHYPVLVHLGCDRDGVVWVEYPVAKVIGGQEPLYCFWARNLDDVL